MRQGDYFSYDALEYLNAQMFLACFSDGWIVIYGFVYIYD